MELRLGAGPALVGAVFLSGCLASGGGDVASARTLAEEYLTALTGQSADRGWSLILPDSRRAYRDEDQYRALVEGTHWGDFTWDFVGDEDYCEDGGIYCALRLDISNAPNSVPEFLLAAPQAEPDDALYTFRLDDDSESAGNAELVVYFGQFGQRGISLGGG